MVMSSGGGVALVFFLYRDRMIHWGVANNCLFWEGVWDGVYGAAAAAAR